MQSDNPARIAVKYYKLFPRACCSGPIEVYPLQEHILVLDDGLSEAKASISSRAAKE